jgi:hypothetical protein
MMLSAVQVRKATSTTSNGFTQRTFLRASAGGCTSSAGEAVRIFSRRSHRSSAIAAEKPEPTRPT